VSTGFITGLSGVLTAQAAPSSSTLPPSLPSRLTTEAMILVQALPTQPDIQTDPDRDPDRDFGQPVPNLNPIDETDTPLTDTPTAPVLGTDEPGDGDRVLVQQVTLIDAQGNPLQSRYLTPSRIAAITTPAIGRYLSIQELQSLADQITQTYLDGDYITTRAILPRQYIVEGNLQIQVIEGRLTDIIVEGNDRLRPEYIRRRIQRGASTPLNTTELENQLRLLRSNPLFESVEASLRAGENLGESILIVRINEANPFSASVNVDNYSPPSVGSERIGFAVSHRNVAGIGDAVDLDYSFTLTDGLDFGSISYSVPINALDGTLQFRAAPNRNSITQEPFDEFNISGKSSSYELDYRQPVIRTPQTELAFSLGLSVQDSQTFVDDNPTAFGIGPDDAGRSRTRVLRLGQDYVRRDTGGAWALRSQFRLGTALFNATENSGDTPDGQFFSWLGQVQRIQRLSDSHLLIAQLYTQLTPDPLLPSQQFVIGGGQSVRGFRQNARSGDNGIRFSIEDRITLARDAAGAPRFQLAPFLDLGWVWNDPNNPNEETDQRFLAGVGLGLFWIPFEGFSIRLDYGVPLVDLDDRRNNLQDNGLYFNVGYGF